MKKVLWVSLALVVSALGLAAAGWWWVQRSYSQGVQLAPRPVAPDKRVWACDVAGGTEVPDVVLRLPETPALPSDPEAPKAWPCELSHFKQPANAYRFRFDYNHLPWGIDRESTIEILMPLMYLRDCDLDRNQWLDPEEMEYALESTDEALGSRAISRQDLGMLLSVVRSSSSLAAQRSPGRPVTPRPPPPVTIPDFPCHAFAPGFYEPSPRLPSLDLDAHKLEAFDAECLWLSQRIGPGIDLDGNGRVNALELEAARKRVLLGYDWNGDGRLNEGELALLQQDSSAPPQQRYQATVDRCFCGWACHWLMLKDFDQNGNGILDQATEAEAAEAALFQQFDADHNRWLDMEEQLAIQARIRRTFWSRSMLVPMMYLFRPAPLDFSSDVVVDRSMSFSGDWWREATAEAVKRYDRNGDGWLDRVETLAILAAGQRMKMQLEFDLAAWWLGRGRLDLDGNGQPSPEEMKSARAMLLAAYDQNQDGEMGLKELEVATRDSYAFANFVLHTLKSSAVADYDLNANENLDRTEVPMALCDLVRRFDADGNGIISGKELAAAQDWVGENGHSGILRQKSDTRELAEKFCLLDYDVNDNGLAEPEELQMAREALLKKYDLDHNGRLGTQEMKAVHQDERWALAEESRLIRRLYFDQLDQDRNGGLNRAEMALARDKALADFDTNHDGGLDAKEFESMRGRAESRNVQAAKQLAEDPWLQMETARKAKEKQP